MRRLPFLVVSLALALLALALAACGGDHDDGHDPDVQAPAATGAGSPGAADVTFAQGMIPHHEQAIEMAEIALDPASGAGDAVADLATRIRDAQDPEIQTMRGWLAAWGEPEMADMASGDHEAHGMEGMLSADELADLEGLRAAEFDRTWMEAMVRHHQGAIAMAETVKRDGSVAEVEALADAIIAAQQEEIDEMQELLDS